MDKQVYVGGRSYPAVEDDKGRLRFVVTPEHPLVAQLQPIFGGTGEKSPSDMAIAFLNGEFSLRDYAEMNIGMGYSIDGFEELSTFMDLEIRCDEPSLSRAGRHFDEKDDIPGANFGPDL